MEFTGEKSFFGTTCEFIVYAIQVHLRATECSGSICRTADSQPEFARRQEKIEGLERTHGCMEVNFEEFKTIYKIISNPFQKSVPAKEQENFPHPLRSSREG